MRTIRPEKLVHAISLLVVGSFGQEFISLPPFDLTTIFKDSSQLVPLIFILFQKLILSMVSLNSQIKRRKPTHAKLSLSVKVRERKPKPL